MPTDDDLSVVEDCERALLTGSVRGDRLSAGLLLHPEFREVGQSGTVWDRDSILDLMEAEAHAGPVAIRAEDLVPTALAPDVVLLTYVSVSAHGRAHRSSVWVRRDGRWQLLHHQGTPVPPTAAPASGPGTRDE
ncbi:MAG TPA: nuclear transport factor 2 family protein [Pedococcus sp.]|nr:nuclear transport factor 2 family protein [Pedococcus sp.]